MFGMFKFKTKEEYLACASDLEEKFRKILDHKIVNQENIIYQRLLQTWMRGYGVDKSGEIDQLRKSTDDLRELNSILTGRIKTLETQIETILNIVRR